MKETVRTIYQVLKETEAALHQMYPVLSPVLPEDIYFITTTELEALYPDFDPRQREDAICKQYGAVFLMQIGLPLKDGKPHDERAADYDDWLYNGDLLLYYPVLDQAFELSSMGIRVDEQSLVWQLHVKNETEKLQKPYAQDLLSGKLPYTIGGGIGQSRMCMFFLKKVHIGEVQASVWPEEDRYKLAEKRFRCCKLQLKRKWSIMKNGGEEVCWYWVLKAVVMKRRWRSSKTEKKFYAM